MAFDTYVRRLGKISCAVSAFAALLVAFPCGSLGTFVIMAPHFLALVALLWLPLLFHRLAKRPLDGESANWAWFSTGALVVTVVAMMTLGYGDGCFR